MINEEGFTEEDLKYINEPFSKKDRSYIYTLYGNNKKKWQIQKHQQQEKRAITEK